MIWEGFVSDWIGEFYAKFKRKKNIGSLKILSTCEKMGVSIGVQGNLLMYLIILSGEIFKKSLIEQ